MKSLEQFVENQLIHGRACFTKAFAMDRLPISAAAFSSAAGRLMKKGQLASPCHGFYLIVRPEDRIIGAPDPARWIDPMMKYLGLDYRISLLRAAAFHGSTHQSSMVFQIIAPKQMREFEIGRHRIEFVFLNAGTFSITDKADWLDQLKTDAGYAKIAGVELTLLDSVRYFHRAGGLNGIAQIVHDIGGKAKKRKLAAAAVHYENSTVRRLGYLLDQFDHSEQASALKCFVQQAKSFKPLDPSVAPLIEGLPDSSEKNSAWMLNINTQVEIEA